MNQIGIQTKNEQPENRDATIAKKDIFQKSADVKTAISKRTNNIGNPKKRR